MRLLSLLLLMGVGLTASAQQTVDVTQNEANMNRHLQSVSGEPLGVPKFTRLVEGSPYFMDQWLTGTMVLHSGQEFKNMPMKLDLMEGRLLFRDEQGRELVANMPIREVVLTDGLGHNHRFFHSSALTASGLKPRTWYLWLASGNTSLYKHYNKKLTEFKPYGSATVEQKIKTYDHYLVLHNNSLQQIEKLKDAPSVLSAKKAELEAFLKTKDQKDTSLDDRFTALVEYYNSLQ